VVVPHQKFKPAGSQDFSFGRTDPSGLLLLKKQGFQYLTSISRSSDIGIKKFLG